VAGVLDLEPRILENSWLFNMMPLTMKSGEDGALQHLFKLFGKKSGIIKDQKMFSCIGFVLFKTV
jgi:hypothetical protein